MNSGSVRSSSSSWDMFSFTFNPQVLSFLWDLWGNNPKPVEMDSFENPVVSNFVGIYLPSDLPDDGVFRLVGLGISTSGVLVVVGVGCYYAYRVLQYVRTNYSGITNSAEVQMLPIRQAFRRGANRTVTAIKPCFLRISKPGKNSPAVDVFHSPKRDSGCFIWKYLQPEKVLPVPATSHTTSEELVNDNEVDNFVDLRSEYFGPPEPDIETEENEPSIYSTRND